MQAIRSCIKCAVTEEDEELSSVDVGLADTGEVVPVLFCKQCLSEIPPEQIVPPISHRDEWVGYYTAAMQGLIASGFPLQGGRQPYEMKLANKAAEIANAMAARASMRVVSGDDDRLIAESQSTIESAEA